MIESGMSLSHMKTDVTIVSHGRVVTRLGPDCQRCKRYGYPVGSAWHAVFWRLRL